VHQADVVEGWQVQDIVTDALRHRRGRFVQACVDSSRRPSRTGEYWRPPARVVVRHLDSLGYRDIDYHRDTAFSSIHLLFGPTPTMIRTAPFYSFGSAAAPFSRTASMLVAPFSE
jgi:hypothetical protein